MKKFVYSLVLISLTLSLCCAAGAQVAVGMLEDASMHSFVLHTDDRESLAISMDDDTQVIGANGLILGERLKVEYEETDDAEVATAVTVLETVVGTVKEATMHTVTIETEGDGVVATFTEGDDTQLIGKKGITVGKKVLIAYDGALSIASDVQNVKVWEIYTEQSISGEIERIEDDALTLRSDRTNYVFPIADAYIDDGEVTDRGNEATLYFFGALDEDADVQQVTVHSVYAKAPEPVQHHLTAVVKDMAMHTVRVRTAKGHTYTFKITNATKIRFNGEGIQAGDTVKCYYTGDYEKKMALDKISLVHHEEEEPEENHIAGRVVDATMNSVTIKSGRRNYVFSIADGFQNDLSNGLGLDNNIIVYYTGTLKHTKKTQNVTVTRITDA